jgi:hypothetical protein
VYPRIESLGGKSSGIPHLAKNERDMAPVLCEGLKA